jgi:hypothetical protein
VTRRGGSAATLDGLDVQGALPSAAKSARRRMWPMKKFLVVCAAICAALYVAYLAVFPTDYLRYRLTLDVDVDGVTRSGSGVVEIA